MSEHSAEFACPHAGDSSHAGLGKAWCDAGLEGRRHLAKRGTRTSSMSKEDER